MKHLLTGEVVAVDVHVQAGHADGQVATTTWHHLRNLMAMQYGRDSTDACRQIDLLK